MTSFASEEAALEYLTEHVPWGCAAGVTKDAVVARKYQQLGMTMVTMGSFTYKPRVGNPGDNFWYDPATGNSINALGIPNKGIHAYARDLQQLRAEFASTPTDLWISVSAGDVFDPDEYGSMSAMVAINNLGDVIEGNFSCPNIEVGGRRKPVVCFDLDAFRVGVKALRWGANGRRVGVKIAPHTEARWLTDVIQICLEEGVDYLVMANTVGNSYIEREIGVPAIAMKGGGAAGALMVPIVSGMLRIAAPQVQGTKLKLIAVGGVQSGTVAYQYLRLGAHGFGFNTLLSRGRDQHELVTGLIFGSRQKHNPGLLKLMVEHGLPD